MIKMGVWYFENYTVYEELDVLRFEDNDGELLGYVNLNYEEIDELNNGVDPIKEGWEDGIGNIININGWLHCF